jgi:hypothetical protein
MYKFGAHPDQPTLFMIVPVDIPDLERPEDWKYQTCLSTWGAKHSDSNEERLRVFKEAASKYAEPWRSAAQWLSDDTYIPPDTIKYWANPEIWPNWNGKVTLAGDGAHPIVPFRAQGLNNALQDAHNYVQALLAVRNGSQALGEAITAYGDEVLARGAAENKLSNMWGPVLHNWQAMMNTPMMKQGYGQTKKAEADEETKETEATEESTKDEQEAVPAEESKPEVPPTEVQSTLSSESSPAALPAPLPTSLQSRTEEVSAQDDSVAESTSIPAPEELAVVVVEDKSSIPSPTATTTIQQATAISEEASADSEKTTVTTTSTDDTPTTTTALQPAISPPLGKPTHLPPPETLATTIAHGQYTPTEEQKSPSLIATSTRHDRSLTPDLVEATEDELATLRKENEALRRRNSLLMQKLKVIQSVVSAEEVGVDDI